MSFIHERANVITHDTILGRSMLRVNTKKHDELAEQMAEFERNNTVTVVPMGATSDSNPLRPRADSIAKGAANSAQTKKLSAKLKTDISDVDNSVKRNRARAKSGYQNLIIRAKGRYSVIVENVLIGVFPLQEALEARDKHRAKMNLPKADY